MEKKNRERAPDDVISFLSNVTTGMEPALHQFERVTPDTGLALIKQETPRAVRPIIFRPGDGTIKIVYRGPTNPCGEVNVRGEPLYDYSLPLRAERDDRGLYTVYVENNKILQGLSLHSAVRKLNEFISPSGRLLKNIST